MKQKNFRPGFFRPQAIRLVASAVIASLPAQAPAGTTESPAEPDPVEPPANWATFTLGGAFLDGDKAAFQRAAEQKGGVVGGISSLHWGMDHDDVTYLVDGHLLFGNQDFDITASATKDGLGYIRFGYKEFRTWYDGSGGFVPPDLWSPLYDDDLHLDRGEVWLEGGLRMEKLPEVTFRYVHSWRDGNQDSTSWSRSSDGYAYGPSLLTLDETSDSFALDVAHTLGNTDLTLGLRYVTSSSDTARLMQSNPGDTDPALDRDINDRQSVDSDLFSASTSSQTRFNDQMMLSFGYNYLNLDTDTGGERSSVNRTGAQTTLDQAYSALVGGANAGIHTLNGAFYWIPVTDLTITTSMRAEWENTDALSSYTEAFAPESYTSDTEANLLTEEVEVRYAGIEDLVVYAQGEWEQGDGDTLYRDIAGDIRAQSTATNQERYAIGANYYPLYSLALSAQYYHRAFDADYGNSFKPAVGNIFDGQLAGYESDTDDLNFRVTWRALPNLSLVTRYDHQWATITNQGINSAGSVLRAMDSADIERNVLSQSVNWTPVPRAYVQGTISAIWAETDTPANYQAPYRIADSDNDSITANLTVGYALDNLTDLRVGYTYFYAGNLAVPYDSSGSPGSVPFGTDLEEHMFNATLSRQIRANVLWTMSYGFYTSNDGTSGNNNDFNAHMLSTGLQLRF